MRTIDVLNDIIEKLEKERDELQKKVDELDEKEGRWKPDIGEEYYYYSWNLRADKSIFLDDYHDQRVIETSNCFKTREEAEMAALRVESMNKAWIPPVDRKWYWFCKVNTSGDFKVGTYWYEIFNMDHLQAMLGMWHPTKEKAEEWGKKYAKAFKL